MRVHTVNLQNGHVVALEPDVLPGKGANVDHAEEIRLSRLQRDTQVLRVVQQGRVGHRLGAGRVGLAHEAGQQAVHLVVVPVGHSHDDLLVVHVLEGRLRVVDDEGPSQAVGVLAMDVGMVPVGAGLVDLRYQRFLFG